MTFRNLLLLSLFAFFPSLLIAQSGFVDHLEIGVATNYQDIYWEADYDGWDELSNFEFGFQTFFLFSRDLPAGFSVRSGIEFLAFQYSGSNTSSEIGQTSVGVSEQNPNKSESLTFTYSTHGNLFTFYIGLPISFEYQPLSTLPLYLIAGTHFYHKIGHSNGTSRTYVENGERELLSESENDMPENANTNKISVSAGIGYHFPRSIPISTEIRVINSITPYTKWDDSASAWSQGASIAVFYRL